MSNLVAEIEVATLDQDLKEIYEDYGSESLYVLKLNRDAGIIDDVYEESIVNVYSEPLKVLGRVSMNTSIESSTGIGGKLDVNTFNINILKSTLDSHGVSTLTTDDKILYLGTELEIKSVKPNNVLGDYFLHYKVVCEGSRVKDWE